MRGQSERRAAKNPAWVRAAEGSQLVRKRTAAVAVASAGRSLWTLLQQPSQESLCFNLIRPVSHEGLEVLARFVGATWNLEQQRCEVVVRLAIVGFESHGGFKLRDCLIPGSGRAREGATKIVVRLGIVGAEPHGFPILGDRAGEPRG